MAQFINPCGPEPDACRSPIHPLFSTGVSVRQIRSCDPHCCDCSAPSIGRYRITAGGTLDRSHWLEGWIYSQLVTRGEVACEEHPLRRRDGGWWADAFRSSASFKSGSKLWALQWRTTTNEALILAKAYALEALQYLVAWGIASRINVDVSYVSQKVMRLAVSVSGPGNTLAAVTVEGQALPAGSWAWAEYIAESRGGARIGPRRPGG